MGSGQANVCMSGCSGMVVGQTKMATLVGSGYVDNNTIFLEGNRKEIWFSCTGENQPAARLPLLELLPQNHCTPDILGLPMATQCKDWYVAKGIVACFYGDPGPFHVIPTVEGNTPKVIHPFGISMPLKTIRYAFRGRF